MKEQDKPTEKEEVVERQPTCPNTFCNSKRLQIISYSISQSKASVRMICMTCGKLSILNLLGIVEW